MPALNHRVKRPGITTIEGSFLRDCVILKSLRYVRRAWNVRDSSMTCASVNNAVAGKIKKDGLAMFQPPDSDGLAD